MRPNRTPRPLSFPAALVTLLAAATGVACSDDHGHDDDGHGGHGHSELPAECQAIRDACHEKDVGVGRVTECHDISHDGVAEDCAPIQQECVQACNDAPDPNAPEDGGAEGTDDGGQGDSG